MIADFRISNVLREFSFTKMKKIHLPSCALICSKVDKQLIEIWQKQNRLEILKIPPHLYDQITQFLSKHPGLSYCDALLLLLAKEYDLTFVTQDEFLVDFCSGNGIDVLYI